MADMMDTLRIASFQKPEIRSNITGSVATVVTDVLWADKRGVDICLFPEAYLTGYPRDLASVTALALEKDNAHIESLLNCVSHLRPTVVVGFIEREGPRFYNSALVVQQGAIIGLYRKRHPNEAGISAGARGLVFRQGALSIGVNICNDANFRETAKELVDDGADMILYPLNNMLKRPTAERWREKTIEVLKERARDTNRWIVSADVVGEDGDYLSFGCTAAISPSGVEIERAVELHEGHVLVDVPAMLRA